MIHMTASTLMLRRLATLCKQDLKKITVPVLVIHSEDDQIVPYVAAGAAVRSAAAERDPENLQGLPARHAHLRKRTRSNSDLLAFIKS